ncbi:unnamed protein product [Candidula unifasciata]|uniref:Peroxiredoxin-5 n=1 Tax=Candidula unifasciata TaxID=100452 RepID=A0A8S3Z8T5_9EUPU|nr:unnamed protein product [Candidula unifasciata]
MQTFRSFVVSQPVREILSRRFLQTSSILNIKVGDRIPSVDLFEGAPDKKVNTSEFSKGKVVIFGVPGAFTPTCSNDHVPTFLKTADEIKKKGVSSIVCVAVNDPFVMSAWGKSLDPSAKIRFLADTTGAFAKALDLTLDLTAVLGNVRNKRFALVAENGVVKGINVEPDGAGLSCSRGTDILKLL